MTPTRRVWVRLSCVLVAACAAAALAGDLAVDWWTIDGGGWTSCTGAGFELGGTIGQPDAGATVLAGGDFELTGGFWAAAAGMPLECPGDSNCDREVNWRDLDFFVAAMNDDVVAWEAMFFPGSPPCPFTNNDTNGDGTVNWRDIDSLVAVMNTTCP